MSSALLLKTFAFTGSRLYALSPLSDLTLEPILTPIFTYSLRRPWSGPVSSREASAPSEKYSAYL